MQTIQSRAYLNVILTVIALLLTVLAFKPYMKISTPAFAADDRNQQQKERIAQLEGAQYGEFATATREVADANKDIAKAIREAAKSQSDIAKAIGKLSDIN